MLQGEQSVVLYDVKEHGAEDPARHQGLKTRLWRTRTQNSIFKPRAGETKRRKRIVAESACYLAPSALASLTHEHTS